MTTETCRDVLAVMLAHIERYGDPSLCGFATSRIRAAIAADDAELARLRRIEDAARRFGEVYGQACKRGPRPDLASTELIKACADLFVTLLPPLMRQLLAAQRIAGEMPELRRRHARMAVEGGRNDG